MPSSPTARGAIVAGVFLAGALVGSVGGWQAHRAPAFAAATPSPAISTAQPGAAPSVTPRPRGPRTARANEFGEPIEEIGDPRPWLETWIANGCAPERTASAIAAIECWSETDPPAALDFVKNAPRFTGRLGAFRVALIALAKQDPNGALAWTVANLPESERFGVAGEIVMSAGEKDPARALEIAFAPGFPVEVPIFGSLIARLAQTAPATALSYFDRLSAAGRSAVADTLAGQWYGADHAAALRWVESQHGLPHAKSAAKGLLFAVAESDPAGVGPMLQRLGFSAQEIFPDSYMLYEASPDAALALLPHLPLEHRRMAVRRMIDDEMLRDPELAIRLARESLPPEDADDMVAFAWRAWHGTDRTGATAWAASSADPSVRRAAAREALKSRMEQDPRAFLAAAAAAGNRSTDADLIERALDKVSDRDPAHAAALATQLGDTVPARAMRELTVSWLQRDEVAAIDWIRALPAGNSRDNALAAAVQHWTNEGDYQKASAAIANISNADDQLALRWTAFQRFNRRNTSEAQQWLATQPLSAELRAAWLTMARSGW